LSNCVGFVDAGYHVIAPDQRGYNTSSKPEGIASYSIVHLVDDIVGLLDAFNAKTAYVAGHDWGGVVAYGLAVHHPSRVEKLIILNVPHPDAMLKALYTKPTQLLKSWYILWFQIPYLPEYLLSRNNFAAGQHTLATSGIPGHTFSTEDIKTLILAWQHEGAITGPINWYRAALQIDSFRLRSEEKENRRVRVPTLILWGEKDIALEKHLAEASLELIDHGSAIFFPNATHWIQHDLPVLITEHILKFFSSSSSSSSESSESESESASSDSSQTNAKKSTNNKPNTKKKSSGKKSN